MADFGPSVKFDVTGMYLVPTSWKAAVAFPTTYPYYAKTSTANGKDHFAVGFDIW